MLEVGARRRSFNYCADARPEADGLCAALRCLGQSHTSAQQHGEPTNCILMGLLKDIIRIQRKFNELAFTISRSADITGRVDLLAK